MISGKGLNPGSVAAAWGSEVTLLAPIIRTSSAYLRALLCGTNGTEAHCGRRMGNVNTCWKGGVYNVELGNVHGTGSEVKVHDERETGRTETKCFITC
jgi:hypothetical protein